METQTNQQENNLNLACPINSNSVSKISLKDIKQCTVQLVRFDEKTIKPFVGPASEDKVSVNLFLQKI